MIEASKTVQEYNLNTLTKVKINSNAGLGADGKEFYEHTITVTTKTVTSEPYEFKDREELENLIASIELEEPQTKLV